MTKIKPKITNLFLSRDWYLPLAIGLLAAFAIFWHLGQGSLDDWDEALHAQVSKEMVQSGDWVTPYRGYEPYFNKPPLAMWLTAGFFSLFGVSEFWARATSAFSGLGILIVTYLIGKFIYSRSVALFSVIILLTSYDFIYRSRFGTTDVLLTFFIMLSLYAYLRLKESDRKWWYLIWISFALAFMTKSAGALVIPAVIVLALWLDKSWIVSLQSRQFWLGGLLTLLIITPWHIFMLIKYDMTFVNMYIGKQIVARVGRPLDTHTGDIFFYVRQLRSFSAWFYLIPFALILNLKDNLKSYHPSRILLIFFCLVFGLYSLIQTKLDWYIFPVYPVLAVLMASMVIKAVEPFHPFAFGGLIIGGVVVALPINLTKVLMMVGLGLIAIFLYLVESKKGTYKRLSYRLVSIVWCVGFMFVSIRHILPLYYNEETPVARLAHIAGEKDSSYGKPLIVLESKNPELYDPTVLFYSDRPIEIAESLEDLTNYTKDGRAHEIVLTKKDADKLTKDYEIKILALDHPLIYGTIQQTSSQ